MTQEEAREKILTVLPYLRDAMAEARAKGEAHLGFLALEPDGGKRLIMSMRAEEFLDDLCTALGAPTENTEEEQLDAGALRIVQAVERSGGRIVSTPLTGPNEGNADDA